MPKPTRVPTHTYNVTANVIDGTIRLLGDINANTIEVPRGENGVVLIADTDDYYLYASENSATGKAAGCWGRTDTEASNVFVEVQADSYNIVYAVGKGNAASVTYGPIITIKPKG